MLFRSSIGRIEDHMIELKPTWTQAEAVFASILIEAIAPKFGAHVALTGGTLYNFGARKDADFLFYRIRQRDEIDEPGLLNALKDLGLVIGKRYGWVQKATWDGKAVDLFFPESTHNDDNAPEEYRR